MPEVGDRSAYLPRCPRVEATAASRLDRGNVADFHSLDARPCAASFRHLERALVLEVDLGQRIAGDAEREPIVGLRFVAKLERTIDVGKNAGEDAACGVGRVGTRGGHDRQITDRSEQHGERQRQSCQTGRDGGALAAYRCHGQDGIDVAPQGFEDVTTYPDLTEVLLGRGHGEADIEKILAENFLRVLQAVTGS